MSSRRVSAGRAGRLAQHRRCHRHLRRSRHVPAQRRQAAHLRRRQRPAHHAARGDQLLPADGVPLRQHDEPDFERLQEFYRLFRAPGVAHCGGGAGPQPQNLFGALVDWVENGVAPEQILAQSTTAACPARVRSARIRRPRSTTAAAAPNDAANFHCGGNLEKRRRSAPTCCEVQARGPWPPGLRRHRARPRRLRRPAPSARPRPRMAMTIETAAVAGTGEAQVSG